MVCPITNTKKGYPFHLELPSIAGVTGLVMIEQTKSLDYIQRNAKYVATLSADFLSEVMAHHQAIFQDD